MGQTFRHSPQPVQTVTNFSSGRAPGGRISRLFFRPLSVWRGFVLMTRAEKRPKPREPRTYLLERETDSVAFHAGPGEAERDGLRRTFEAFETGDAVLLAIGLGGFLRDGSHGTVLDAFQAAGALRGHRSSEDSKTGGDGKEGSQRAEIPAPESFPDDPQGQDADEDDEDEKVDLEEGQGNGRDDTGFRGRRLWIRGQDWL